jgi:XTP/dITP diphosphohydrolase
MLEELKGVPAEKRTAHFACVIALCLPGEPPMTFRAECAGRILAEKRGAQGFGYDPIFEVDRLEKTFAELSLEEKNRLSHRARAVKLLRAQLQKLLSTRWNSAESSA